MAFKVLRTRLKTVPSYTFGGEQSNRMSSGNAFAEVNFLKGSPISEDGDFSEDQWSIHNGIDFSSRLQLFEQVQEQHRLHYRSHAQFRASSISSAKVCSGNSNIYPGCLNQWHFLPGKCQSCLRSKNMNSPKKVPIV